MGNIHGYQRKNFRRVLKNFQGIREEKFSLVPCLITGGDFLKVYDCFTFYNEFELLELRLKALWDVVDYFVIVEANRKHNGEPKEFSFWARQKDFKDFLLKIRFIPADLSKLPFKGVGDWSIENAQRNAIMNGIGDAAADDLIFVSDLDEFPAPDILQRLQDNRIALLSPVAVPTSTNRTKTCMAQLLVSAADFLKVGAVAMIQTLHYYYFDWVSKGTWPGTVLTKRKNMTTPQELRLLRDRVPRVLGGGYHFSYMGGADRVIEKMTSIVDGNELVVQSGGKLADRKHVEVAMAKGTDVYDRQGIQESQFMPYDVGNIKLPCLDEFLRKYPHFLREPEKYFKD